MLLSEAKTSNIFGLLIGDLLACGGGRIGVNQDREEDASTMAQGTHLHLGRMD